MLDEVKAEGVLQEALGRVFEEAAAQEFQAIGEMDVSVFDANDGFILLGLLNKIPGCEKTVLLAISYKLVDGSECEMHYEGSVANAQEFNSFFAPKLRAAADKNVAMTFGLVFGGGLALDRAEDFAGKLAKVGAASAYIIARRKGA